MQCSNISPPGHYERPDQPHHSPGQTHLVERGDTLYGIARQYGVPPQELIAANPQIANPDLIYPGDTVHVPIAHAEEPVCAAPPPPCAAEPPPCAPEPPLVAVRPWIPVDQVIHPVVQEPPTPALRQPVESADGPESGRSLIAILPPWLTPLVRLIGGLEGNAGSSAGAPRVEDPVLPSRPNEVPNSPWIPQQGPLDDLDLDIGSRLPRADGRLTA